MQLSNNTLLQEWGSGIIKTIIMLIVLTLCNTSLYAQAPIKKPEKKQQATTTTKPKPNTNKSSQTSSSTKLSEPTGYINGHGSVDLGLSVKWATCNVGASSPSDYGNYYAWGETSTKSEYTKETCKTYGKKMGSIAGDPEYDAARANWGGTWRLPTASEIEELLYKCKWEWTTQGGHNGYKVTGPNGNSIFLPAAGWRNGTSLDYAGERGRSWGATPDEDDTDGAYLLSFGSGYHYRLWDYRNYGRTIRPVTE